MLLDAVCPSRNLQLTLSTEPACCLIDLAATWCTPLVRAVPVIIEAPRDVHVKLAFLRVADDVTIRLQRISRDATDDTNAPPTRIKDTPARETESGNVLKNFYAR